MNIKPRTIQHGSYLKARALESEISQAEKDPICFHSYVDPEKLNRRPWGRGRKKKVREGGREANHKRLLKTENKLRVDGGVGGRGKWVMGIEEGTCWDEHWVLYGNQFDNKFHIKEKDEIKQADSTPCFYWLWSLLLPGRSPCP